MSALPPPSQALPATRQTHGLAVVSLVSGILAWMLFPVLCAIVAIVTGHLARRDMRSQPGRHDGDGLALAGLILGWTQMVLLGLFVLGVLFVALLVAVKGWG